MCDPVSIGVGLLGTYVVAESQDNARKARNAANDQARAAEAERAAAEASAIQSANAKLAQDNRRRREQKSLLAQGAPQPTMGDTATEDVPILSPGRSFMTRSTSATRTASLMSRGAPDGQMYRPRTPSRAQAI